MCNIIFFLLIKYYTIKRQRSIKLKDLVLDIFLLIFYRHTQYPYICLYEYVYVYV